MSQDIALHMLYILLTNAALALKTLIGLSLSGD